jgi:hypothetical protein
MTARFTRSDRRRAPEIRLGLLRKHRGMLLATPHGCYFRDDPGSLWWNPAKHTSRC